MPLGKVAEWLSASDDSLRRRVVQSGLWATALNVSMRVFQVLKLVILARILVPSDFGIVAIGLLVLTTVLRMTDVGFDEALVQREEQNVDHFLDTTWLIQGARGVALFVLLYLAAPTVASIFSEPSVTPVLRVLSTVALFKGFTNPAIIYFRKELRFHKEFAYQVSGTGVNVIVAIGLAVWLGNLWALVFGVIAGEVVQFVMSFVLTGYRPGFSFDYLSARELFGFGKWIYGSSFVLFLAQSGDDLFVGWLLGAFPLGLYRIAFQFGNAPATEIANVLTSVLFPTYSKLQNDVTALRKAFATATEAVLAITVPMTIGIVLIAPDFTLVVLGEKWLPMVPAFQVLAIAGFMRTIVETGRPLFRGYGIPEWDFRMGVVKLVIIGLTIWPLSELYGILGTAASVAFAIGATIPIWLYKTHDITSLPFSAYGRISIVPTVSAGVMALPVYYATGPTVVSLAGGILVGLITYPIIGYSLYRLIGRHPIAEIRAVIS